MFTLYLWYDRMGTIYRSGFQNGMRMERTYFQCALDYEAIMNTFMTWGLRISIVTYTILHFFTSFFEIDLFISLLSFVGIALFIFSIFYISITKFKLPLFILSIGVLILLFANHSLLEGILEGMLLMRGMVGFLVIIPLISWVLREEPYIEDIMAVFHRFINTSRKFYLSVAAFTQVIAYFLLFGSIPMMYQFVNIILKDQTTEVWENFKGTALLRGFSLSTMWVISIPSFIFAVETLGASLWIAILQGVGISVIGVILAAIFAHFTEKRYGVDLTPTLQENIKQVLKNASHKKVRKKKVIEFFCLFVSLFGTIFLIHGLFQIPLMLVIPIVIIVWIITFYVIKKKANKLFNVGKEFFHKDMLGQTYQLNIMLAVGVLIYGLRQTEFATVVVDGLNVMQEQFPIINPLFLLPFIVIILGLFGLGPLTVMVLVAGILGSMNLPYPPELIVLAVTSGSVISTLISPVIMPVIVLSGSNGLSLFTNGVKFNWKYAIAFYFFVQIYLQTMSLIW